MKASNKILHEKQYAERILEITGDTMFFVYKDGTCLDFKPNRPDFYIKEEEVVGKNIFSYFPLETARKMHKEFKKVIDGKVLSSAENYKLILGEEVKYYKCIISKFNEDHLIFQYRDITGRSVVRLKLEKKINDLREVEKAAHIGLWTFDSLTRIFTYSGYTQVFCDNEEEKTITFDEYITYIHPEDKTRVENWIENYLHGKESQDTISYKLLINGKIVDMRLKIYNREVYTNRILLEGYIQNTSEIVWKAERSNQLKSAFLANMSHEIRTPLNAILGFSRIIAETDNSEERLQYYDIVEKNNMRLQELINEILDLSKIESGMMEFNYAPVNLYKLCDDVKNTYRFRCQSGVDLIFEQSDRSLYMTDTGTGIPAEKLPKIFDRFMMANDNVAGTGLGLSISKIIAEKLGGKIWVNSKPGKGTTFTFTIPYISVNGEVKRESHTFTRYTNNKESTHKEIVILVAEDNQSNYDLIEAMIGKTYKLVHALDGMEAIQLYEKYSPNLILMDIKMPNLDGLDATRIIREVSPKIPVIAVSAYAYEKDKAAAIESGCNEFLTKPISPDLLKDTINKYLKNT